MVAPRSPMLLALLAGFLMGFVGSVPIAGPIAILVFEHAARGRASDARRLALGAAVAESLYAFGAYFGLTNLIARFPLLLPGSRIVGAVVLTALGVYFIVRKAKPKDELQAEEGKIVRKKRSANALVTGFTVTLVNPTLLATWAGAVTAISSMGIVRPNPLDALPFAGGVGVGITLWFMVLTALVDRYKEKISEKTATRLVRGMGALLVILGVAAGVKLALAPSSAETTTHQAP